MIGLTTTGDVIIMVTGCVCACIVVCYWLYLNSRK